MDPGRESQTGKDRADRAPDPGPGAVAASEADLGLRDFVETIAEKVAQEDPVVTELRKLMDARIAADDVELPRHPDVAARILHLAETSDASMRDVMRHVRTDPALAGRLLEMANSAAFAGAQPVYSLKMAVVRLGLTRVGEIAFGMSGASKNFHTDKRSNMLMRMWKYSLAVGFVAEELARLVPGETPDAAFLTGLFHNVAGPLVVECVGRLERSGAVAPQSDSRVLGLVESLAGEYTQRVLQAWGVPRTSLDAIALQDAKIRERKDKPLAHLLVCAKALAAELGLGVRPRPLDFTHCRDFRALSLDNDAKLEPVREATLDKMIQAGRS
jgi:HD-like signal output (HDOD) protein